jgi:hypothetical protein
MERRGGKSAGHAHSDEIGARATNKQVGCVRGCRRERLSPLRNLPTTCFQISALNPLDNNGFREQLNQVCQ